MILVEALRFASERHQGQLKKGTSSPFLYHPMAVASLVLKYGGTEAQAAAALLHDTIGEEGVTEALLRDRFGAEVAALAYSFADPALPPGVPADWRSMKFAYLEKLQGLDESALLVVACEELHDGSELMQDLRYHGILTWKRYPVHAMDMTWYYRELLKIFMRRLRDDRHRGLVGEFAAFTRSLSERVFEGSGL